MATLNPANTLSPITEVSEGNSPADAPTDQSEPLPQSDRDPVPATNGQAASNLEANVSETVIRSTSLSARAKPWFPDSQWRSRRRGRSNSERGSQSRQGQLASAQDQVIVPQSEAASAQPGAPILTHNELHNTPGPDVSSFQPQPGVPYMVLVHPTRQAAGPSENSLASNSLGNSPHQLFYPGFQAQSLTVPQYYVPVHTPLMQQPIMSGVTSYGSQMAMMNGGYFYSAGSSHPSQMSGPWLQHPNVPGVLIPAFGTTALGQPFNHHPHVPTGSGPAASTPVASSSEAAVPAVTTPEASSSRAVAPAMFTTPVASSSRAVAPPMFTTPVASSSKTAVPAVSLPTDSVSVASAAAVPAPGVSALTKVTLTVAQEPEIVVSSALKVPSKAYKDLTANSRPSLEQVLATQYMPFTPLGIGAHPVKHGVVKITGVPFNVTKNQVVHYLGRLSGNIIHDSHGPAVHFIMDRMSGKVSVCYVEFPNLHLARMAVARLEHLKELREKPHLGGRSVIEKVSSQAELMKDLFPKARCVEWDGHQPVIHPPTESNTTEFSSFITADELVEIVRQADIQLRGHHKHRCFRRPFESMISILTKFPWWMVNVITLATRDRMFEATTKLTEILVEKLDEGETSFDDEYQLQDLVQAVLKVQGFTELQKSRIICTSRLDQRWLDLAPLAAHWPFSTLGLKRGAPEDLVKLYAWLLAEGSKSVHGNSTSLGAADVTRANAGSGSAAEMSPFGTFHVQWTQDNSEMTLYTASLVEWDAIFKALRRSLPARY